MYSMFQIIFQIFLNDICHLSCIDMYIHIHFNLRTTSLINNRHFLSLSGEEEQEKFITELEGFIAQLLKMVEVELKFDYETLNKISGQIHGERL